MNNRERNKHLAEQVLQSFAWEGIHLWDLFRVGDAMMRRTDRSLSSQAIEQAMCDALIDRFQRCQLETAITTFGSEVIEDIQKVIPAIDSAETFRLYAWEQVRYTQLYQMYIVLSIYGLLSWYEDPEDNYDTH